MEIPNLTIKKKESRYQINFTLPSNHVTNSFRSQFLLYHVLVQYLVLKKELGVKGLTGHNCFLQGEAPGACVWPVKG